MDSSADIERYVESCQTNFWKAVFQAEITYLVQHLAGCKDILSVGCGPAAIESALSDRGFSVTGLDVSREALDRASDNIRTVAGRAEDMPLPKCSFDAVIYVASLQFVEDYERAINEAVRVLRPGGRLIAMLLNPESGFFKAKLADADSYMHNIRHAGLKQIEDVIAEQFTIQTEYFLGIKGNSVFESRDASTAAIYVVNGKGKH